mmetsp:Transcript_45815/g.143732  ORF Transcript_45815/g.143732 Transcript_45815/m.143732 type:complete len:201 (-) Transcript_45815:79-681(-)
MSNIPSSDLSEGADGGDLGHRVRDVKNRLLHPIKRELRKLREELGVLQSNCSDGLGAGRPHNAVLSRKEHVNQRRQDLLSDHSQRLHRCSPLMDVLQGEVTEQPLNHSLLLLLPFLVVHLSDLDAGHLTDGGAAISKLCKPFIQAFLPRLELSETLRDGLVTSPDRRKASPHSWPSRELVAQGSRGGSLQALKHWGQGIC